MRISLIPVPSGLDRTPMRLSEAVQSMIASELSDAEWRSLSSNDQIEHRLKALRGFTFLLLEGAITAYIWSPSRQWYSVPKGFWWRDGFTFHEIIERVGFVEEYQDCEQFLDAPNDIRGQPFVIWAEDIAFFLDGATPSSSPSNVEPVASTRVSTTRGRTPGSGGYAKADEPLLAEMRILIASGEATSTNDAAGKVAHKAKGSGLSAKQDRLRKRYAALEKIGDG